jgi:ATP adenylyltransferase
MNPMAERPPMFERGSLWSTIVERTARALASGALVPIRTEVEVIEDGGVPFLVRVVSTLERKDRAVQPPPDGRPPKNPFLPPYEEDLFVSYVPPAHACLLNKFNVFDHHALLVTRAFEEQDSHLTPADFEALLHCTAERNAGASQSHKHLQFVQVPLAEGGRRTPIDEAIARGRLPFPHALGPPLRDPAQAHILYRSLLRDVGCDLPGTPYNLLATRDWTMVVPRTQESFDSISLNALAFAGSLLVKNREQLERVRAVGPMAILRAVTGGTGA